MNNKIKTEEISLRYAAIVALVSIIFIEGMNPMEIFKDILVFLFIAIVLSDFS